MDKTVEERVAEVTKLLIEIADLNEQETSHKYTRFAWSHEPDFHVALYQQHPSGPRWRFVIRTSNENAAKLIAAAIKEVKCLTKEK